MKVGTEALSHQFAHRAAQLAVAMKLQLTYEQADELYNSRSTHVHAAEAVEAADRDAFGQSFVALYETLRAAVRRALEDPEFASTFDSEAAVQTHWPLPGDDPLVRGLRRVLRRQRAVQTVAGDAMSWVGQLAKKTGVDMATAIQVAQALAAVGSDPGTADALRRVLAELGRDDLAAVLDEDVAVA